MITKDAFITGQILLGTILSKMSVRNKRRKEFISHIIMLILGIRGRINFLQLSRQGNMNEKSYRYHFEKVFNWLSFNRILIGEHGSDEIIIGFDPSFITKSGKSTPHIGYFYSGCASSYKRGIEIGSFAAIDVKQNTAYHLEAITTPSAKEDKLDESKTLVDHYAELIVSRHKELEKLSTILVCDGYFAKKKYVDAVCEHSCMELISRLRDDANLKYLYKGKQREGRGRPKKHDGKVDVKAIDMGRFHKAYSDSEKTIYTAVVYSVGLRRNIKLCYVTFHTGKNQNIIKLFFSTNLDRSGQKILTYYRARYQMEYIFRDAKQHMGLQHCQARSSNKLNFHFNASMTSVSVSKAILRNGLPKDKSIPLSVSNIKVEIQNRNMVKKIFSIYGFDHNLIKIKKQYHQILDFGKIAA